MNQEWMGADNRAVAILRVSSYRQKDNTSHDTQEREIREYCGSVGLELAKVEPIMESAKTSEDRVKYARVIAQALTDRVRHIVFYMYDRETRNLTDNEKNEQLVRKGRLVLHYARERKVLFEASSDSDFFMRDISAVTSKQFIRNLRSKVSDAMRNKAESGWFPGNWPPLGYVHVRNKDDRGRDIMKGGTTIGVDPDERRVRQVRREFELRAQGVSLDGIRAKVIAEGLVGGEELPRYRKNTIHKRLANPFYSGHFVWEGLEYKGKHPIIIPSEHLEAVQGRTVGRHTTKPASEFSVFGSGWLKCAECGCAIVYDPKKKVNRKAGTTRTFHYYRCSNSRKAHMSMTGMNVSYELLWAQFERVIDSITITTDLALAISEALNADPNRTRDEARRLAGTYRAKLEQIQTREDAAFDNFATGALDQDAYKHQMNRIRTERAEFQRLLAEAERIQRGLNRETVESVIELAKNAKVLWVSRRPTERKAFLEMLCSNQRLRGKALEFQLQRPFDILLEMKTKGWRPQLDELRTFLMTMSSDNPSISFPNSEGDESNHERD